MVLGKVAIQERLEKGEIFRKGTSEDNCIKEASYALRVAEDGLLINGNLYPPGTVSPDPDPYFSIKPGEIAIFSTMERLNMPNDLVGHLGMRYDYAVQGLTRLMGIQVDPAYGQGIDDERLYMRVANIGNNEVKIRSGDKVFNVEFRTLAGGINNSIPKREPMWERLEKSLLMQPTPSWTNLTQVQYSFAKASSEFDKNAANLSTQLDRDMEHMRQGLQPVVLFGVFLVAATLLSVAISVILNLQDIPKGTVPTWVTNWGWIFIMISLGASGFFTSAIGAFTAWHFFIGNGVISRMKRKS